MPPSGVRCHVDALIFREHVHELLDEGDGNSLVVENDNERKLTIEKDPSCNLEIRSQSEYGSYVLRWNEDAMDLGPGELTSTDAPEEAPSTVYAGMIREEETLVFLVLDPYGAVVERFDIPELGEET